MQQNNRTNEKTFLNTIKEPIAYNVQNVQKHRIIFTILFVF